MIRDPVILCYWDDDKSISHVRLDELSGFNSNFDTLFGAMERFLVRGERTEILEYYPRGVKPDTLNSRVAYWTIQLRELGYAVGNRKEQADD